MKSGRTAVAAALLVLSTGWFARGEGPQGSPPAGAAVVLDTAGFWRMHHVLKGLEVGEGNSARAIPVAAPGAPNGEGKGFWAKIMVGETAAPSKDWAGVEFDDSTWVRGPARRACRTPFLSRLCLRSKFMVSDPAKAGQLTLSLEYHGGAVVFVNGQEVARQHFPPGAAIAEAYPPEAFVDETGKLITLRGDEPLWKQKPSDETARRIASRERKLTVAIPAKALRQGLNVLAIELVRAPYHKSIEEQMPTADNHGVHPVYEVSWNTCEVRRVQLTAPSAAGLVPEGVRPEGFQVWNSDLLATDYDVDFGGAEELRPIRLLAARNGVCSGKVVVGSSQAIRGISATAGELKGEAGGVIPASAIRIRWATPWGDPAGYLTNPDNNELLPYPAEPGCLLALNETPPKEIPVYRKEVSARCLRLPGQPVPVFGAVAPVWMTVHVPADAKPGTYTGQIALAAEGWKGATAPVSLKVADWKIADPAEHRGWVELIQSPDTLAVEYGLPMWSPKHWEMIGKSMSFLAEAGSKVLFVPLIAQTNVGNAESMVRWIKKSETQYEFDFSIMDKYLDLAQKQLGKPEVVIFNAWDRYLGATGKSPSFYMKPSQPLVTVVDPATGKTQEAKLPVFSDPASQAIWKGLFDQLRERMKKRGLEKAMHLGMVTDVWAAKEQIEFLKDVSGGLPWANAAHYFRKELYDGLAKFGYQSSYFGPDFGFAKSRSGWKNPQPEAVFERVPTDVYPMQRWRTLQEMSITTSARGIGRLGADTWYAVKDKTGRRIARVWERYPGADWGYLNANCSALAPSPEGPVATQRFEALREGAEECEAQIALEEATTDAARRQKLGEDLAKRCEQFLQERHLAMWKGLGVWQQGSKFSHEVTSWRERTAVTGYVWFLGSGWQERSERLYGLAAEVGEKLSAGGN